MSGARVRHTLPRACAGGQHLAWRGTANMITCRHHALDIQDRVDGFSNRWMQGLEFAKAERLQLALLFERKTHGGADQRMGIAKGNPKAHQVICKIGRVSEACLGSFTHALMLYF